MEVKKSAEIDSLRNEVSSLKRSLLLLSLSFVSVFLVAASNFEAEHIKTKSIEIVDSSGATVIELSSSESGGFLQVSNRNGSPTFASHCLPGGSGALCLWDRNSKIVWKKQGVRY